MTNKDIKPTEKMTTEEQLNEIAVEFLATVKRSRETADLLIIVEQKQAILTKITKDLLKMFREMLKNLKELPQVQSLEKCSNCQTN